MRDYGLVAYDAGVLVAERETADYFEAASRRGGTPRAMPNSPPIG
jgi:aspartyl-tRNA(Asn)/glutamyl-tRNA(Gln) amidotransferase subunit B